MDSGGVINHKLHIRTMAMQSAAQMLSDKRDTLHLERRTFGLVYVCMGRSNRRIKAKLDVSARPRQKLSLRRLSRRSAPKTLMSL